MLGQRRRQYANIKPMLSYCVVFSGDQAVPLNRDFLQHQGESPGQDATVVMIPAAV